MTKFTKTAKFTKIHKTIDKVYVIYSKGCREALSKVRRIAKMTKTAKFTIIRQTSNNINEIYSRGYREVPSKVTRIAKITKFTKTAKFTKIHKI